MSPAVLNWSNDFTIRNNGFKKISKATNEQKLLKALTPAKLAFLPGIYSNGKGLLSG
jgi:hypothetical protein